MSKQNQEKAVSFIQKNRKQGIFDDVIVKELVKSGWKEYDAAHLVTTTKPPKKKKIKKIRWPIITGFVVLLVIIILSLFYWFFVENPANNNTNSSSQILPDSYIPTTTYLFDVDEGKSVLSNTNGEVVAVRAAAKLEGYYVEFSDFEDDLLTIQHFYQSQDVLVSTPDEEMLAKQILTRLIQEAFLENELNERGLTVTNAEVESAYTDLITATGDAAELEQQIKDFYNWDTTTFKERAIRPYVIRSKVEESVTSEPGFGLEEKERAEAVHKLLITGRKSFDELVKEYNEDVGTDENGVIGFIERGQTEKTFEDAAFSTPTGQTSDLIETDQGYHIIKVLERDPEIVENPTRVKVAHIFIYKKTIDDWLIEQLADASVIVYVSNFIWEDECGLVLSPSESCDSNDIINTVLPNYQQLYSRSLTELIEEAKESNSGDDADALSDEFSESGTNAEANTNDAANSNLNSNTNTNTNSNSNDAGNTNRP